jgi:hypothetical protein
MRVCACVWVNACLCMCLDACVWGYKCGGMCLCVGVRACVFVCVFKFLNVPHKFVLIFSLPTHLIKKYAIVAKFAVNCILRIRLGYVTLQHCSICCLYKVGPIRFEVVNCHKRFVYTIAKYFSVI